MDATAKTKWNTTDTVDVSLDGFTFRSDIVPRLPAPLVDHCQVNGWNQPDCKEPVLKT